MQSSSPRLFVLLPLVLLAVMMTLGLVIEEVRYHTLLWATKIPLAILLAVAFLKDTRER
jgi:Cu/Ag efflux pump CusA